VEQAWAGEVVHEAAGARDEPPVFLAPGRSPDQLLTRSHEEECTNYETGLVALSENISGSRGNRGPRPQQPRSTGSVKAMTFHTQ